MGSARSIYKALQLPVCCLLLVSILSLSCKQSGTEADPVPQEPTSGQAPRIIAMAPALTELLYALGLGKQVVGVCNFSQYPPEVRGLPKVGALLDPNLEAILRLQPDYVIIYTQQTTLSEQLQHLGLKPLAMPGNKLADVYRSIEILGQSFGVQEQAQTLLTDMRERFKQLQRFSPDISPRLRVMLVVWRDRGLGTLKNICVAGNDGFYSEMIQAIGAELLPVNMKLAYPSLGPESILQLNPDLIIEIAPELAAKGQKALQAAHDDWQVLPELKAVQNGQVYILTDDFMALPGPRCILAGEKLAETIAKAAGMPD